MHKEKKDEGAKNKQQKKGNRKMELYNDNEDVDSSSSEEEQSGKDYDAFYNG